MAALRRFRMLRRPASATTRAVSAAGRSCRIETEEAQRVAEAQRPAGDEEQRVAGHRCDVLVDVPEQVTVATTELVAGWMPRPTSLLITTVEPTGRRGRANSAAAARGVVVDAGVEQVGRPQRQAVDDRQRRPPEGRPLSAAVVRQLRSSASPAARPDGGGCGRRDPRRRRCGAVVNTTAPPVAAWRAEPTAKVLLPLRAPPTSRINPDATLTPSDRRPARRECPCRSLRSLRSSR